MIFLQKKFWELVILKNSFFLIWPFWFFFCFIPMKISPNLYGRMDGSKFWWFQWFPENSLQFVILRYAVYESCVMLGEFRFSDFAENEELWVIYRFFFHFLMSTNGKQVVNIVSAWLRTHNLSQESEWVNFIEKSEPLSRPFGSSSCRTCLVATFRKFFHV